jgi:F-type H+-transporting ATPase subunit b
VLDSWVRYEANVRDAEQKKLTSYLAEKIQVDLQDSKVQQQLLQQAIADVEKLVKA